ncbi:GyrI-like domain-containing protein [Lysinibacillus pakistanensis]|uniref:GyrI-like domain-containing protein n=1 Tax=Lysinibacillus pakistanensis TaxID=759811 RepID=A0AAX3X216_9BACI|nr:GyrI-like domain-containing protein [Lysinibacillus pakistanensis]MDM5232812.1 GyrI-like domain-containing protein [Lysinibacillus pakistanensis]WHY48310.1 GyrI-like domain-containing protein [Lysinibacillus pakistanensis]WHY53323.1 GyrI-like domain-containing protein [Lysinibacillus pakistanensis]
MKQNKEKNLTEWKHESSEDKITLKQIEPTRIEELTSFTLAGISAITTNETERSKDGKIGKLFEQFHSQNIGKKLGVNIQEDGHYSCYFNYEQGDAGLYEIMVSVKVQETSQLQSLDTINTFTVPAAKYAVFVTEKGPIIEMVQRAWDDIWQWSQQPDNNRAFTGDFEYYSKDINPEDGQAEIYISIK